MSFMDTTQFDHYRGLPVLVTGGAGFIGSHLTGALLSAGANVTVIDDLSGGSVSNLVGVGDQVRFIHASILDERALADAVDGCRIVFHEAALASVPASIQSPLRYHKVNVTGTVRLLMQCVRSGVRRVVFASSSSVYGDQPVLPKSEEQLPDPLSPYAQQKLTGEHLLRVWSLCYGLECVSLRYFNIFGPGQSADSAYAAVVAAFANALLTGAAPRIFGDGQASRDFTNVNDVVQANLLAGSVHWSDDGGVTRQTNASANRPVLLNGGVCNIGCGGRVTVLELLRTMKEVLRCDVRPIFEPPRAGDVLHSHADITRARKLLGYEPRVNLADGLRTTLEWYRSTLQRSSCAQSKS